jgi:hypothetical protein
LMPPVAFASNSGMGLLTTIAMDFVSRVTGLLVATWGLHSPVATRDFTLKWGFRPSGLTQAAR